MMFRFDEDGHRRNQWRCAWTCVWSLLVAAFAFAVMFFGPVLGQDAACFVSFVFTVAAVLFTLALLLLISSALLVGACRALSARMEERNEG